MAAPADLPREWDATLLAELTAARERASQSGGSDPLGLRAVELGPGQRWYLCAFAGPTFLCLDVELRPERDRERVREVAAGSLLVERAEGLVDAEKLSYLAAAAGRLLAATAEPTDVASSLEVTAQRALELAAWRESPQREVASVASLDAAVSLHDRLRAGYGAFVAASEPLVERQDSLDPELVSGLRVFEEAAGRALVGESLATLLGQFVEDCDEGAKQIMSSLLAPPH